MHRFIRHIPIIETLRTYKKEYIKKDFISGLTVAVVAIPQSMAYAIIAGVNPAYGLYTAILSTIFSSAFGNSNHLIAGPTNAISLLIAGIMQQHMGNENAYDMLFLLTFMVGTIQILAGVLKLGRVINYVSNSVVVGFTAGAGILIGLGQLNQFLGITIKDSSKMVTLEKVYYTITHPQDINFYALGLGLFTILVIILCRKWNKNIPGSLISMALSVLIVVLFSLDDFGIKLIGDIPSSFPAFRMIRFNFGSIEALLSGALSIAIIGLVEAMSISKSIASLSHQKIDANQEFLGQGAANLLSSFFQSFPGSGSFTRSSINYNSGAVTRMSGIFSGVFVALTLLFFAPYAKYIPMASLAGVIMITAYNMVDKKEMKAISKTDKSDSIVMWGTFGATVLLPNLDHAIYAGIILSILMYLKNTNTVPVRILVPSEDIEKPKFCEKELITVDRKFDILIIQIEGNLYFGSAFDFDSKLNSLVGKAHVFILRMKRVNMIDVTCLDTLKVFIGRVKSAGGIILASGISSGLNSMLLNSELAEKIGKENIFLSQEELFFSSTKALQRARKILKK